MDFMHPRDARSAEWGKSREEKGKGVSIQFQRSPEPDTVEIGLDFITAITPPPSCQLIGFSPSLRLFSLPLLFSPFPSLFPLRLLLARGTVGM